MLFQTTEKHLPSFFIKDVEDHNPLIRALAIRTMGYIQVEKIVDVLIDPLRHCLRDRDPYVRKTAATCVAKLYMYDKVLVESEHFVDMLRDLLGDPNPTVKITTSKDVFLSRLIFIYLCRS